MFSPFETSIRHIYDVAYIKDAASRYQGDEQSLLINRPLHISIIKSTPIMLSHKLTVLNKPGVIIFNQPETFQTLSGTLQESDRERPDMGNINVTLAIKSSTQYFNPRLVDLQLGNLEQNKTIWLYRDLSTSWGSRRSVYGQLVMENGTIIPWAILHLKINYQPGNSLTLYAQANAQGDFDIPLNSVPQPARNISTYSAELTILAPTVSQLSTSVQMMNPDQFVAVNIGIKNKPGTHSGQPPEIDFQPLMSLDLKPDKRTRLLTRDHDRLIIKH